MSAFSGSEPLVGEIVGLRTFRVDDGGLLLPLYSSDAWYDGANTATCAPPTGPRYAREHAVPDPDCECGFYAYGTREAARHNRNLRHVQAVVALWGEVVAGTQGVRAEHARIVALWLDPAAAPAWLRHRVARRYPSAQLYQDADAMLAEHPLTELDCYEAPHRRGPASRGAALLGAAGVLGLGLLPVGVLQATSALWVLWLLATVAAGALAGWLALGTHGAGHLAAALVVGSVLAWLLAPLFGLGGWLLRLPLLRGLIVAGGGYLLALRPHHFPVVRTAGERAFCGVRP